MMAAETVIDVHSVADVCEEVSCVTVFFKVRVVIKYSFCEALNPLYVLIMVKGIVLQHRIYGESIVKTKRLNVMEQSVWYMEKSLVDED